MRLFSNFKFRYYTIEFFGFASLMIPVAVFDRVEERWGQTEAFGALIVLLLVIRFLWLAARRRFLAS